MRVLVSASLTMSAVVVIFAYLLSYVSAFAPHGCQAYSARRSLIATSHSARSSSGSSLSMMDSSFMPDVLNTASTYLSTIDADIDSIPTDQFGTVFAGGIAVMFGGVFSALMVGWLLEQGGGYADIVAETYAEQDYEKDETFWESLGVSPEERKETEDMLMKFREKRKKAAGEWTAEDEKIKEKVAKEKDMFSDYDDE